MPKKMKRVALAAAFTAKHTDGEVMVVDTLGVKEPKTREVVQLMNKLGLSGRVTFIVPEKDETFERAARNLRYVRVLRVGRSGRATAATSPSPPAWGRIRFGRSR